MMSSLKYKPSSSTSSTANSNSNLPIWCSLSTPSQIARKYASIAPIWCHISRPRQLKQKFKSTFHQAQSLLSPSSRTHSKDTALNALSNDITDDDDEDTKYNDMNTAINTFKNANKPWQPSSALSSNIPASISKSKISSYNSSNYDGTNNSNELTSILKKRENSTDLKLKSLTSNTSNILQPNNTTSYLYNSIPQSLSNPSSRWTNSTNPAGSMSKKETAAGGYENNSASTIVGSFYEENHLPALASHTGENSTRRPNKYISKYSSGGSGTAGNGGSKTEKIISKSSKSSPNLLKEFSDRYEQTNKWQPTNTTTNSSTANTNPYHSSTNSSYGNYGNYSTYNFQPATIMYNGTTTSTSNNPYVNNMNREEKWNELDSMLGAQSALLSRLESDFVANRNKAKPTTAPTTTTTPTTIQSTIQSDQ